MAGTEQLQGRQRAGVAMVAAALAVAVVGVLAPPASAAVPTEIVRDDVVQTQLGFESVYEVESDAAGNVYVFGKTFSTDFPIKDGLGAPNNNGYQGFLRKYSPSGELVYSTRLPIWVSNSNPMVVEPDGTVDVISDDSELLKISASGKVVSSFTKPLAPGHAAIFGMAPDGLGGLVLTGAAGDIATTPGAYSSARIEVGPFHWQPYNVYPTAGFVARVDGEGQVTAATYLPAAPRSVAVTGSGRVVVAGTTERGAFGSVPGADSGQDGAGEEDAFIAQLSPGLTSLDWAAYLGGGDGDRFESVAIGPDGTIHAVGVTQAKDFEQIQPLDTSSEPKVDEALYAAVSADGAAIRQLAWLGGQGEDFARDVEVGSDGAPVFVGQSNSTDFPLHGTRASDLSSADFVVRVEDLALTHAAYLFDRHTTDEEMALATTPDGLVHIGANQYDRPADEPGGRGQAHMTSVRLNPYVDQPEAEITGAGNGDGPTIGVSAGAAEDVLSKARAKAKLPGGGSVRLRATAKRSGAYRDAKLKLKPTNGRGAKRLRKALAEKAPVRVRAKVRFEDRQGTVAGKRVAGKVK